MTDNKRYSDAVLLKHSAQLDALIKTHHPDELEFTGSAWRVKSEAKYKVFTDDNGVAYIQVAITAKGERGCVINDGTSVRLALVPLPNVVLSYNSDVLRCAKNMLHPLNESVTVTPNAKAYLEKIIKEMT